MLSRLLKSLRNIFSSLFGTGSSQPSPPPTTGTQTPSPPPVAPPPSPTPPPQPTPQPTPPPTTTTGHAPSTAPPLNTNEPQDASELQPDTVIIVAHELEEVPLVPGEPDADFDEEDFPFEEEPSPAPEPEPEPTPQPTPPKRQPRYLWCLDNGHGSQTAGKRSPKMSDGRQFFEYEFNRDIVGRIIEQLEKEGIAYYNVVPEVNVGNILQERVTRANSKASRLPKIYLSVHANAGPAPSSQDWTADSIRGVETWFYHGSKKGQRIARVFQKHIVNATGFVNRHLKSRPERQFYVLRKTRMPAVLTENGFYNNRTEVLALLRDDVRQKIADAHVAAILEIEENGM